MDVLFPQLLIHRFVHALLPVLVCAQIVGGPTRVLADGFFAGPTDHQFQQALRQRGLHRPLIEYSRTRLAQPRLSVRETIELTIELADTLGELALESPPDDFQKFWAESEELLRQAEMRLSSPGAQWRVRLQRSTLQVQLGTAQRWWAELRPFEPSYATEARSLLTQATQNLEQLLADGLARLKSLPGDKALAEGLPHPVARELLHGLQVTLGEAYLQLAALEPEKSPERSHWIIEARTLLQPLADGAAIDSETWTARADLATAYRLAGDTAQTLKRLSQLQSQHPPAPLGDRLLAERVALGWSREPAAQIRQYLLDRPADSGPWSNELLFWHARLFAQELRDAPDAEHRKESDVELRRVRQQLASQRGGIWLQRADQVIESARVVQTWGEQLAVPVQKAELVYRRGDRIASAKLFTAAAARAQEIKRPELAWDLNYRAGSILIEQQEWTAAIATLRPLQQGPADAARRGQAHLLACFAAGRRLDALTQSTAANAPSAAGHPVNPERKPKAEDREVASARELYLTLLQEHRQQFPDQPSHAEATWMLARLAEQQQNWIEARQRYAEIPLTHPKAILALSGLSRVLHRQLLTDRAQSYRGAVSRTDTDSAGDGIPSPPSNPLATSTTSNSSSTASNNTWTASMRAEAIQELERRLQPWLSGPDAIGTEAAASAETCDRQLVVAEAALVLAELRLSAVEPDFPAIEKSLGAVTQLPRLENPVLSAEEEAQATRQHPAVNYAHRWQQLLWRATQLRIVALAAQGEIELARDQLQTLAQASPDELLAILAGLDQLRNLTATNPKADLSVLELDAAQQLHRQRDRLTPAQQIALDERRANAFFRTGDLLSAQALYEELLKSRPQDAQLLRPYARLLSRSRSNDARSRALGIWKKLEQQQRAGSTEWLEIRAEVISLLIEMQDQPAALKLLKVTRTLYPKAGSPQLQQRFKELEARCQPADAKSRSGPIPKDKPGRK